MGWKILILAICLGAFSVLLILTLREWRKLILLICERRKERKAKKLAVWLDYERISNRLDALLRNYADDKQIARMDMDILNKRITNAFEYITTVMAAHELAFHTKAAPKKPAKKNPRRTPEQLNSLIEMVRKA